MRFAALLLAAALCSPLSARAQGDPIPSNRIPVTGSAHNFATGNRVWTALGDLFVDPFIGSDGHGHTFPGASVPFGMVQLSPDTRLDGWDGCSGYHGSDDRIFGFSHTHLSGTGCSDYGDILFFPSRGTVQWRSSYGRTLGDGYGSPVKPSRTRHARAGAYSVLLADTGILVELTATARTGWQRYTFPQPDSAFVLLDLTQRDQVLDSHLRVVNDTEIEGYRVSRAWATNQRVYFVARFSRPVDVVFAVGDAMRDGMREAGGTSVKAAIRPRGMRRVSLYDPPLTRDDSDQLLIKVGISAVDIDGARRNLDAEAPDWDIVRVAGAAAAAWDSTLRCVDAEGGTDAQRTTFYTALYHTFLQPNLYTDVDGRYRGRDDSVHVANGWTQYTVFSLWDTFRAAHPLYALLQPARDIDFINTFLAQYDEGGALPVWELSANETNCMIGYHAVPVIADAWAKGLRGFDGERALEAMIASASAHTRGLDDYRALGFIPADREAESVSKTLEYAYDDWCIARMAASLGHADIAANYDLRAQSWKNGFDPQTGFMRPKLGARWKTPFSPTDVDFHFTEANSWQYSFFVPQDIAGHIAALGGSAAYAAKLDSLFGSSPTTTGRKQDDISGLIGQYAHGNEPSHHMAYLYDYCGQPWKTQRLVAQIRDSLYRATPDGLIGNEDCGQMSAWYVFSAFGFYPVTPGQDTYAMGSPLFPRAVLRVGNGRTFTITRTGDGPYIQSARLNGKPFDRCWIRHGEITAGGTLAFAMGHTPNTHWGVGRDAAPPSTITAPSIVPAPFVAAGDTPFRDSTRVVLGDLDPRATIYWTTDGEPTTASARYTTPITVRDATTLRFRAYAPDGTHSETQSAAFLVLDPSRRIALQSHYSPQYPASGPEGLIDGVRGGNDFRLGAWQGYDGTHLDAVVDLGSSRTIASVACGFLQDQNSWIFMPRALRVDTSLDSVQWEPGGASVNSVDEHVDGAILQDLAVRFAARPTRYIRLHAESPLDCPAWHKGHGNTCWIFADEIVVR